MAFEFGVVVKQEGQRVIDLHWREMLAHPAIGETEELCELPRRRFFVTRRNDGVIPSVEMLDSCCRGAIPVGIGS